MMAHEAATPSEAHHHDDRDRLTSEEINYRDEGLYSEDGFDWEPTTVSKPVLKRLKKIREVSAALQKEFPDDYRLESDLYAVGPTPFIIGKIRKGRRTQMETNKMKQVLTVEQLQGLADVYASESENEKPALLANCH